MSCLNGSVYLINSGCSYNEEDCDVKPVSVQKYPPLGLMYLESSLRSAGISSKLLDAAALDLTPEETASSLISSKSKYAGFYTTLFNLSEVKKTIELIKERGDVDVKIIIGGPHVTHFPKSVPQLGADYGIAGEGENALVDLVSKLENGAQLNEVENLISCNNGKINLGKRENILDLDSLHIPNREILDSSLYNTPVYPGKVTTMITSRGCPFDCLFCALPNKRYFKQRSPSNVLDELEIIAKQGYRYVEIQDDMFSINKEWTYELCEGVIQKGLGLAWGCETRADCVNYEMLDMMRKSGCKNIKFGIEAGSDRVRNEILGKKLEKAKIIEAFKATKRLKIETMAYFILGNPTETIDETWETINFAEQIDPDYAEFHIMFPIAGSPIFNEMYKAGEIDDTFFEDIANGGRLPTCISKEINEKELINLRKKAYTRFYLRPKRMYRFVKNVRGFNDMYCKILAGLKLLSQMNK